jgi:hypothetical protein
MRLIYFSVILSLALLSSAIAQQPAGTTGDTIDHPTPLPGPPPIAEPSSTTKPAPAASTPQATEPAPKGYIGAYGPPGPAKPYSTGPLPQVDTGSPGLDVAGPDGSTKTVRAVPCSAAAHETDGSTTCVGIPDQSQKSRRR